MTEWQLIDGMENELVWDFLQNLDGADPEEDLTPQSSSCVQSALGLRSTGTGESNLEIPSSTEILSARRGLDKWNEDRFWSWVDPTKDHQEVARAFDIAIRCLYVLQRETVNQRPRVEVELTFTLERIVSHAYAFLTLIEKGFVAESGSVLRTMGEGCNLIELLSYSEGELRDYLASDQNHREGNFNDSKVRNKLQNLRQTETVYGSIHRQFSRIFSHFSTGSVHLNSSIYPEDSEGEFGVLQKKGVLNMIGAWATLSLAATHFGLKLVNPLFDDPEAIRMEDEAWSIIQRLGSILNETDD